MDVPIGYVLLDVVDGCVRPDHQGAGGFPGDRAGVAMATLQLMGQRVAAGTGFMPVRVS